MAFNFTFQYILIFLNLALVLLLSTTTITVSLLILRRYKNSSWSWKKYTQLTSNMFLLILCGVAWIARCLTMTYIKVQCLLKQDNCSVQELHDFVMIFTVSSALVMLCFALSQWNFAISYWRVSHLMPQFLYDEQVQGYSQRKIQLLNGAVISSLVVLIPAVQFYAYKKMGAGYNLDFLLTQHDSRVIYGLWMVVLAL